MTALDLSPSNATPLQRALSLATDSIPRLEDGIAAIAGAKFRSPHTPVLVPWLIAEWGLGPLTPYVQDTEVLLLDGPRWQRKRGTPAAVDHGLAWLNYVAELEEESPLRRRWNLFQLALGRFRDTEEPDLGRIEGITDLSAPLRSQFWRGFNGYDVRALTPSESSWGGCLWADYSGERLHGSGAKWSFGRAYEIAHTLTEAELTALGVWLAPSGGAPLGWGDFTWMEANAAWDASGEGVRLNIMSNAIGGRNAHIVFRDASGVIGYRRCRCNRAVSIGANTPYVFAGTGYVPNADSANHVYVEALTGFGDGYGRTSITAALVIGAAPTDPDAPGQLWTDAVIGGVEIPLGPLAIEFGRTSRERVAALLSF